MSKTKSLILAMFLCLLPWQAEAALDYLGTDFWVAFGWNGSYQTLADATDNVVYKIIVTAEDATEVEIANDATGYAKKLDVSARSRTEVDIPASEVFLTGADEAQKKALHITSKKSVSVVAYSYSDEYGGDATTVIPTQVLSNAYYVQNTAGYTQSGKTHSAWFVVVATADKTTIRVTPKAATIGGHKANATITKVLSKGQAYMVMASGTASLDGSYVNANRQIVVYCGNTAAKIPADTKDVQSPQQLYEVAYPSTSWGTRFIITPSAVGMQSVVRITASQNNTTVRMRGNVIAVLQARETYTYVMFNTQGATYIETSAPAACYQYLTEYDTSSFGSLSNSNSNPAYVWVAPFEQRREKMQFSTISMSGMSHYLSVVVPTQKLKTLTLDGSQTIQQSFKTCEDEPLCSYAVVKISEGYHTLTVEGGAVAYLFGISNKQTYAYNIGTNIKSINDGTDLIVTYEQKTEDATFCDGSIYDFHGEILSAPGQYQTKIHTVLGDTLVNLDLKKAYAKTENIYGEICWGNQYIWDDRTYSTQGDHQYTYISEEGCDSTVTLHLTVKPMYNNVTDEREICYGTSLLWEGDYYQTEGEYTKRLQTVLGCDSIVTLKLTVAKKIETEFYDTICPNTSYIWDGRTYSNAGDHQFTYQSVVSGCDSVVTLHLALYPEYRDIVDERWMCDNESLQWEDMTYSAAGDYIQTLKTIHGCDSVVTLRIYTNPTYATSFADTIISGNLYMWNGVAYSAAGDYEYKYQTVEGCDSVVTLNLLVNNLSSADFLIDDRCADEGSIDLEVNVNEGWFDHVSVFFDAAAKQNGFVDTEIDCEASTTSLTFAYSPTIKAGIYSMDAVLYFHGQELQRKTITFSLLYPSSVIQQLFDDVLAVPTYKYNGGYNFVAYQWYENDMPIADATKAYYGGSFSPSTEYSVLLTDDRGVSLKSCPFMVTSASNTQPALAPSLVRAEEDVKINIDGAERVTIYSMQGQVVEEEAVVGGYITAPQGDGVYIVRIYTADAEQSAKLIVKE